MRLILSALLVGGALAPMAMAQLAPSRTTQEIPRLKTERVLPGREVNTDRFVPQINPSVGRTLVKRPENKFRPIWRNDPPSTLERFNLGEAINEQIGSTRMLFPGIGFTGFEPPDPDLAVGPNHLVAVVNSSVAFYQKNGTLVLSQTLASLFSGLSPAPSNVDLFDPKALYDRINNRFVVVTLEARFGTGSNRFSNVLLAVSDDNNPSGTWRVYRINVRQTLSGNDSWLDYPGFGYNRDGYVITGNMFNFALTGFFGAKIVTIRNTEVLTGAAAVVNQFIDSNDFGLQVNRAQTNAEDRVFMLSDVNTGTLRTYAVTDLLSATPTVTEGTLSIPAFSYPTANAPSAGGRSLDSLDGRLLNVHGRNGRLVTTHAVRNAASSQNFVRWYEIQHNNFPSANMTLVQSGNITGATGVHHWMPAIGVNELGDIAAIFSRSSTTIVADIMAAGRRIGDAAGTFGVPFLVQSSAGATYGPAAGGQRWGDYHGIETDPNDETTFWGYAMNGSNTFNAGFGGNVWKTEIFSFQISAPITLTGNTIAPSPVNGGTNSGGTVTISANAPIGGYTINLASANPAVASVPMTVTIPAGANSANYVITTFAVVSNTDVGITASFRGVNQPATITVQPAITIVNPETFSVVGTLLAGNLASLPTSDDNRMRIGLDPASDLFPPIQLTINGTSPVQTPSKLELLIETRTTATLRGQAVFFFNFAQNRWDRLDYALAPTGTDASKTIVVTTNVGNYVQAGTRRIRARLAWDDVAAETIGNWSAFIDRSVWRVTP